MQKTSQSALLRKIPKNSRKFLLKFNGSKSPSIYVTSRGDFYCSHHGRKVYLGRDAERANRKLQELLDAEEREAMSTTPATASTPESMTEIMPNTPATVAENPAPVPETPPPRNRRWQRPVAQPSQSSPSDAPKPLRIETLDVQRHSDNGSDLIMSDLILRFLNGVAVEDKTHIHSIRSAMRVVLDKYGNLPACDFGPLALKDCRQEFIRQDRFFSTDQHVSNATCR